MQTISQTQPRKKGANKLILGFAAVVASAVVGTTGFAAAASTNNSDKPTKQQCIAAGFKNYGQCVKEWAKNKNHPGGGYGSANTSTNVNLALTNSNNNVIQVIIHNTINIFR